MLAAGITVGYYGLARFMGRVRIVAAHPSQLKVVGGVVYAWNDFGNSLPYSSTSSASSGHLHYGSVIDPRHYFVGGDN